ncbi:MAG: hypothetical protein CVU15_04285 [Betaproteobacteria bacterium HGW-Betaproteobacteria-1]|jgi:formiminotetrahydrofolate cyclodeaminase|nr:MAG: hypothetical protein CVU15_04285 [Betaproteobacteria bacterium HGW-Betaproteobacteria-1]
MTTDKKGKFVRLAESRVLRTIKYIRLIGNLSNKNNYTYTDKDVSKIIYALEQEIKTMKAKFSSGEDKDEPTFKL